jgi:hypothetical protein
MKHERLPSPRPRFFGGEGAPAGVAGAEKGAARRFVRVSKLPALRAVWNDSLSRPCRATLSPQGGEGTASGASSGKVFSSILKLLMFPQPLIYHLQHLICPG